MSPISQPRAAISAAIGGTGQNRFTYSNNYGDPINLVGPNINPVKFLAAQHFNSKIINMQKIYYLILISSLSGCGFIVSDLNMVSTGNVSVKASEEEKMRFEKARQLIGKTKQEVLNEFGVNMRASKSTGLALAEIEPGSKTLHPLLEANLTSKSGINSYYRVDEVGFYKFDNGIPMVMPDEYGVYFYFINDICVYVSGS